MSINGTTATCALRWTYPVRVLTVRWLPRTDPAGSVPRWACPPGMSGCPAAAGKWQVAVGNRWLFSWTAGRIGLLEAAAARAAAPHSGTRAEPVVVPGAGAVAALRLKGPALS